MVHDESDLLIGQHKFSFDRGSAGQRGVDHIQKTLGTSAFWRLRIGIRPPELSPDAPRIKASSFVLRRISKEYMSALNKVFEESVKSIPSLQ